MTAPGVPCPPPQPAPAAVTRAPQTTAPEAAVSRVTPPVPVPTAPPAPARQPAPTAPGWNPQTPAVLPSPPVPDTANAATVSTVPPAAPPAVVPVQEPVNLALGEIVGVTVTTSKCSRPVKWVIVPSATEPWTPAQTAALTVIVRAVMPTAPDAHGRLTVIPAPAEDSAAHHQETKKHSRIHQADTKVPHRTPVFLTPGLRQRAAVPRKDR